MSHDQPDNARRLRRLGVADSIGRSKFRAAAVADKLRGLLDSREVKQRCLEIAQRFEGVDAIGATCDVIDSLAERQAA